MAKTILNPPNQFIQQQQQTARGRPVSTPLPIPYRDPETLGEGEFGKVKLGMHADTHEEVAVKLIRKESVESQSRMQKIQREIGVLQSVMHPNIVKLYDVFETDKYIGIIMEYASGGELFDHILAHRYLKERDACRLFAQLISGVDYLHQKHIVHRDLKLENLLLDRNRNIIITDFGFANQFDNAKDDLMATSCGSPCYAAPELVISEGLYVGSAVDIWSCGVILYAMLSGYLPFDDDPDNPDGENINLLYKYIINTPLVFPEYVSPDARDLLRKMLVPDPAKRCDMKVIMSHRWLAAYTYLFQYSIRELEAVANPLHSIATPESYGLSVPNSSYLSSDYRTDHQSNSIPNATSTVKRHTIQVEYDCGRNAVYDECPDEDFEFVDGTRLGAVESSPSVERTVALNNEKDQYFKKGHADDEPVVASAQPLDVNDSTFVKEHATTLTSTSSDVNNTTKNPTNNNSGLFTLFEGDPKVSGSHQDNSNHLNVPNALSTREVQADQKLIHNQHHQYPKKRDATRARPVTVYAMPGNSQDIMETVTRKKTSSPAGTPPFPSSPTVPDHGEEPLVDSSTIVHPTIPPPPATTHKRPHKRATSTEKLFKYMGTSNGTTGTTSTINNINNTLIPANATTTLQKALCGPLQAVANDVPTDATSDTTSLVDDSSFVEEFKKRKAPRRKALSMMVDSFRSTSAPHANASTSRLDDVNIKDKRKSLSGMPSGSSSNAAKKVMDWFRRKSFAKNQDTTASATSAVPSTQLLDTTQLSVSAIQRSKTSKSRRSKKQQSVIDANSSNASCASSVSTVNSAAKVDTKLRVHHGAVDNSALTSRHPYEVFIIVKQTLVGMGIETKREGEFKVRCVRRKRKTNAHISKDDNKQSSKDKTKDNIGVTDINVEADKKKRKYPSSPFKTLLRRASSTSAHTSPSLVPHSGKSSVASTSPSLVATQINVDSLSLSIPLSATASSSGDGSPQSPSPPNSPHLDPAMTIVVPEMNVSPSNNSNMIMLPEVIYGDSTVDSGDEIRFSVELCRISNLPGLYIVDIRRLKGNIWSYKFLYHTILEKLDLGGKGYLTIGTSGGYICAT
ncbi:9408_t:CDS:10 [Paraglomus brasilianum]|uniref:non-specific serine/threonine protein kinase n=1 Tax=Paraglomus brasilianum TaxID=144538 RepID=A0A9N8ZJ03_9GLOM|nr:9408_t:CDS:10 [Paraglomus brasilianum]